MIMRTLGGLFTRDTPVKQLMGPVAIAGLSGEAAQAGWLQLFSLVAMISLNLGLLNLMPVPVLDGGHITILALEGLAAPRLQHEGEREDAARRLRAAADADGHGHLQRPRPACSGCSGCCPGGNSESGQIPSPKSQSPIQIQLATPNAKSQPGSEPLLRAGTSGFRSASGFGSWDLHRFRAAVIASCFRASPISARVPSDVRAGGAGGGRRAGMDHHGHGRHAHGRPARRRSDRRRRPRQRPVHRGRRSSGWGCCSVSTPLVSQAFGAGRLDECHRWLLHGCVLALLLTVPTTALLFWMSATLDRWGMNPDVLRLIRPYLDAVAWSTLPLLLYFSFRRYLQGRGRRPADHDHADRGEPVERGRELDPDLRPSRSAGARRRRLPPGRRCCPAWSWWCRWWS